MTRPVRPLALVILTFCMVYPGVTMLYQGLYPLWAGDWFNLVGETGPWMSIGARIGLSPMIVSLLKAGLGAAWLGGVLGIWAGDWKAYPLALIAAVGSLLYPGGAMVMAVLALIALIFLREKAEEVPA
jgi:hypothetical protein